MKESASVSQIVSLFTSQQDAAEALETLHRKQPSGVEVRVLEGPVTKDGDASVGREREPFMTPAPGSEPAKTSPVAREWVEDEDAFTELGLSEEEAAFFQRGMQSGGVIVVVNTDEDKSDAVYRILDEKNGRTINLP